MRYIFIEDEKWQSVYDLETMAIYGLSAKSLDQSKTQRLIIERADREEITELCGNQAISFWRQLAKQVDGRCGIKDVRNRMEAFVESAK